METGDTRARSRDRSSTPARVTDWSDAGTRRVCLTRPPLEDRATRQRLRNAGSSHENPASDQLSAWET